MYYKQNVPKIAQNYWGNGFYNLLFPLLNTNHPPWKTGATQFEWITSKKIQYLHENTKAMGFMRLLFHHYTQITPLENGGHTVLIDYKQKIPKYARNPWGNGFYEVLFP